MIILNNDLLVKVSISNMQKKLIFCLRVRGYKTAQFKGYFLGARADLDIHFKFAPEKESRRKKISILGGNFKLC